jgi:hypothetical protein
LKENGSEASAFLPEEWCVGFAKVRLPASLETQIATA